jgi:hypothetical protein
MRNVLLSSVGAPLLGDLSSPLRTPLVRSDTAFEVFATRRRRPQARADVHRSEGVEHCTFEDAEVHALLVELAGVANTGDAGGSLTATSDDSPA